MIVQVLLLVLSLVILYLGAECALDGAEKIGRRLGLSSLVIGVVIVGFGTSLPELFVSQLACFRGHDELALGNIIGSNLANILLIMGVATVLTPLSLKSFSIKRQMVFHLILTVLLAIVLINFSPWGFLLLALFFAIYMRFTFKELRPPKEERPDHFSWWTVGKLMAGSFFVVDGRKVNGGICAFISGRRTAGVFGQQAGYNAGSIRVCYFGDFCRLWHLFSRVGDSITCLLSAQRCGSDNR